MSALEDIDAFCEQHRQRLHDALTQLIEWSHADGDCPHDPLDCLAAEYEDTLRQIDVHTINTGTPWHVALAYMTRITETQVTRIEEGQAE